MELTILLSKVFGFYFLIVGAMMILHHGYFRALTKNLVEEPMLRFLIGAFMLMGGVFLVVAHQDWSTTPASFISVIGWLTVLKALVYMNITNNGVRKMVNGMYKIGYVWWASFIALGLGLYLLNFVYGFF